MAALSRALRGLLLIAAAASARKCQKGVFNKEAEDAAVVLCDEHFPHEKVRIPWLILFYSLADDSVREGLNRIARELGNVPPGKTTSLTKPLKQRARIKALSEKYDFEVHLPKDGPSGSSLLLRVGAVCCDCGSPAPRRCEGHRGLYFVKAGTEEKIDASLSAPGSVMKAALQRLGYLRTRGQEKGGEL